MTDAWGRLHVEVLEDEIIITPPFTNYTVDYKPANTPELLAKNFSTKDDSRVPTTQAEFLERAWKLANDKARELGWIALPSDRAGGASHALRPTRPAS